MTTANLHHPVRSGCFGKFVKKKSFAVKRRGCCSGRRLRRMASSADGERRIPCTIRLGFHLLPQPRCFCGLPSAQPCSCSDNLHTQTTGTRCAWLSPLTGAAALEKKVAQAYRDIYDTILLGMVTSLSKRPGVVDVKVKEQPGADQVRAITSLRRRRWQHRHPPSRDPLPVVVPVVIPPPCCSRHARTCVDCTPPPC